MTQISLVVQDSAEYCENFMQSCVEVRQHRQTFRISWYNCSWLRLLSEPFGVYSLLRKSLSGGVDVNS